MDHRETQRPRWLLTCALALTPLLSISCDGGPTAPNLPLIMLPVRVHLLASPVTTLNATFSQADVQTLVDRTNEIWSQAAIRWSIESIVDDSSTAAGDSLLVEATQGSGQLPDDFFQVYLPQDRIPGGGWDVYIVHNLSILGGAQAVYLPSMPAIVTSEDVGVLGEVNYQLLAHVLGFSLSLHERPCPAAGNLMSDHSCQESDPTHLTSAQVDSARAQAELGRPSA